MNRREFMAGAAGAAVAGCAGRARPARPDLVRAENARPGSADWILSRTRVDPRTRYRSPWIEGYCSHNSIRAGETLRIMVSTNPPAPFTIDLYRMGYYGGAGARRVLSLGPLKGAAQPDPPVGPERLRSCAWEPAAEVKIPADWPSGVYLGKLTEHPGGLQSYVIFIVRDDRPCDLLFQCSDTTWCAYNRWPSQWSLYDDGAKEWYWGPDVRVGFDRPYGKYCQIADWPLSQGSGEFLLWEFPLAYWLEARGYDVSYVGNLDTHADGEGLRRAKAWLSVGHDEYWSRAMYDNVRAAIDAGVNVAFFSSNTCCGLIDVGPGRTLSRLNQYGVPDERTFAGFPEMRRFKVPAPDEGLLLGARTVFPVLGVADWTCALPDHWIFEGTGMKAGDGIASLVGWEWEGRPADLPGLEVVARGKVGSRGAEGEYTATIYPGPRGNHVFSCSTIWWADGLAAPPGYVRPSDYGGTPVRLNGPDPRVQRITSNILTRFTA